MECRCTWSPDTSSEIYFALDDKISPLEGEAECQKYTSPGGNTYSFMMPKRVQEMTAMEQLNTNCINDDALYYRTANF